MDSHNRFQQVTRNILWHSVIVHNQNEFYMVIRQSEFAMLQLIHKIDELLGAIQCMI